MARREHLGPLVRQVWVDWAREQPDPKPGWLTGWDDLDEGQREVDMRIGEAVAGAERERVLDALRQFTVLLAPMEGHKVAAVPWADVLQVLRDA